MRMWSSAALSLSTTRCSLALYPSTRSSTKERQKGYTTGKKGNEYTLTKEEKDELLRKWKKRRRELLTPPFHDNSKKMIVEEVHITTLILAGNEKRAC
eukprot:1909374-Ditylum_brightwellii.AAC.1